MEALMEESEGRSVIPYKKTGFYILGETVLV